MRKFIYLLTSFVALALFMFQSSFAADPNDYRKPNNWQAERIINDTVNRSTVKVDAAKTYPVSTLGADGKPIVQNRTAKSSIKVAASVSNVGKSLFKRVPNVAITTALFTILGKSVEWVMDEENNAVKYKAQGVYYWMEDNKIFYKHDDACNYLLEKAGKNDANSFWSKGYRSATWSPSTYQDLCRFKSPSGSNTTIDGIKSVRLGNPSEEAWERVPIDTVAQQVITDADAGNAPAMQVMTDTALDMLEAGLLDPSLDAASDIPQPDPDEIPDPDTNPNPNPNPDPEPDCPAGYTKEPSGTCVKTEQTGIELPAFCDWAIKVCDFIDWVKTEPTEPPDGAGDIEVEQPDPDMHVGILERLYINMPAECPPDPILEFMGAKIPFPMSIFCQFAEMMKPLILLFAYIKGLSIIGNGLT